MQRDAQVVHHILVVLVGCDSDRPLLAQSGYGSGERAPKNTERQMKASKNWARTLAEWYACVRSTKHLLQRPGISYQDEARAEKQHDSLAPPGPRFYGEAIDGAAWRQTATLDRHLGSIAADSRTTERPGARRSS